MRRPRSGSMAALGTIRGPTIPQADRAAATALGGALRVFVLRERASPVASDAKLD